MFRRSETVQTTQKREIIQDKCSAGLQKYADQAKYLQLSADEVQTAKRKTLVLLKNQAISQLQNHSDVFLAFGSIQQGKKLTNRKS